MTRFSREDRSLLGRWWWTVDRPLLVSFLLLIVIGVMLVTTASPPVATHLGLNPYHFLIRHLIILIPALVMLFAFSMMDAKMIWRLSSIGLIGCLGALVLVLMVGIEIKGAQRWLHLPGFSLQPAEFVKPCFVIVSAWLLTMQKIKGFPGNMIVAVLYAIIAGLLISQPDLGMTVILTAGWASLIFIAGLRFRLLIGLAGFGVFALMMAYLTLDHVQSRVNRFLDPNSGDTYQVDRAIEAFQNGGLMGTGPGQGRVKLMLPDSHADFIFAVAGEEMGLMFILILVFLYGFIVFRGLTKLTLRDDLFSVMAAGSLLTIFGLQAFVHMGSALSLLPAKGMTLPFISYGGSSLLSMGYAMGVVLALTKRTARSGISKGGLSLQTFATSR